MLRVYFGRTTTSSIRAHAGGKLGNKTVENRSFGPIKREIWASLGKPKEKVLFFVFQWESTIYWAFTRGGGKGIRTPGLRARL
jgi:hypothetical protein